MGPLATMPIVLIGLLLNCTGAWALSLEFDHEFKNATTKAAVLQWSEDALSKLPPSLLERLPGEIRVRFRSWGKETALAKPYCAGEASERDATDGSLYEIYGRYNAHRNIIYINLLLLREILLGPSVDSSFDCYHGNFYRLATATLLHEIAHAYDASDLDASIGKSVKRSRISKTTVSSDPLWAVLDGFNTRFLGFRNPTRKNKDMDRLPSAHAGSNEQESFAVHLEYFLLDADYRCRFPSHQEYFENHFDWSPVRGDCGPSYEVISQQSAGVIDLNPERIYQVRYLMASPGQRFERRFGHAMLHFVLCAPGTAPSPECLEQEEEDIVLSFAARTDGSSWRRLKSMVGISDSLVFFKSLKYQLQIYNQFETRDVRSYAIDLSREQIRRLTLRALELYWTYRGPYRFLSINCATEAEDLLKAGILDETYIYGKRRTPGGVLKRLQETGLIDKVQPPLVYQSKFDDTSRALTDLYGAPKVRGRKSLHRRIGHLSYDERRRALEQLEIALESTARFAQASPSDDSLEEIMRTLLSLGMQLESFRLLEENIARHQDKELGSAGLKEFERLARRDDDKARLLERFRYLVLSIQAGDRDSRQGYGIPLRGESGPDRVELGQELGALRAQLFSWDFQSTRFSRWQQEINWTETLADSRYRVLISYADVAREVRTEIITRAVARFPELPNSAIRSMLEEQFGEASFESTRISDERINGLRAALKNKQTIS